MPRCVMSDGPQSAVTATAAWIAAARARESRRPDRLFDDPWADQLAGPAGSARLAASEGAGGENPFLPVRTRFFDDVLRQADWAQQIVLLGAGLDTRAYRLPLRSAATIYEIDHAEPLARKAAILAAAAPACTRQAVVADLRKDWGHALLTAGFRTDRPTFWLAEGLMFYLAPADVTSILAVAASLSEVRARFAADIFGTGLLRLPSMQPSIEHRQSTGRPPPFCTDAPVELFAHTGWPAVDITEPGQPTANFGRLPALPVAWAGRSDPTMRTYLVIGHRNA
jgi:methyltransferase (TIGR00027 family)